MSFGSGCSNGELSLLIAISLSALKWPSVVFIRFYFTEHGLQIKSHITYTVLERTYNTAPSIHHFFVGTEVAVCGIHSFLFHRTQVTNKITRRKIHLLKMFHRTEKASGINN